MASYLPSPDSKGLFSGTPVFVVDTYDWADDFEHILGRAIASAVEHATKSLRYAARQDDRWLQFEENVSVQYGGGDLHYVLTGTDEEIKMMEELEYGTPEQPPSPLLRPQLLRQADILGHHIDLILAQEAPGAS